MNDLAEADDRRGNDAAMTRRKANWIFAAGILCVAVATVCVVVIGLRTRPLPRVDATDGQKSAGGSGRNTLWTEAGWTPEDFFDSEPALRACELISKRKHDEFKQLLDSDFDVNQSGKAGMTLLYWAFGDDNLEAFELLLESGADPDQKLTDMITLRVGWLYSGDSILFSSIKSSQIGKWDFFFAALEQTSDMDQRDGEGNTLLIACMGMNAIHSTSDETLQRLLDSGVPLDAQNKKGGTAAFRALLLSRPLHCLRILKAGADPETRDAQGRTVADWLAIMLADYQRRGETPPTGTNRLKQWLDSHRSKSDQ